MGKRVFFVTNNITFLSLQETKIRHLDLFVVRSIWGNITFDFDYGTSKGLYGALYVFGILLCLINAR